MNDIEKLIERLCAKRRGMTCDDYDAILGEAADALACLVAPLPEEVAKSVEWLDMGTTLAADGSPSLYRKAARLLESQAREIARLEALLTKGRKYDFEEWWMRVGRLIDPEPSVNWYDKRKDLMAAAFAAAKAQSGNYVADVEQRPTSVTFAN